MSYALSTGDLLTLRTLYTEQQPVGAYTENDEGLPKEKRMREELGWNRNWHPLAASTLTLFMEQLDDGAYISGQVPDPTDPASKINVLAADSWENKGVELALEGKEGAWGYQASYSKVDPGETPTGVVNVPEELVKLRLAWKDAEEGWFANLGARSMSEFLSANKAGTGDAGGFVSYDAAGGRSLLINGQQHTFRIYAKNLTGDEYETVYGFPSEGMTYGADYRFTF